MTQATVLTAPTSRDQQAADAFYNALNPQAQDALTKLIKGDNWSVHFYFPAASDVPNGEFLPKNPHFPRFISVDRRLRPNEFAGLVKSTAKYYEVPETEMLQPGYIVDALLHYLGLMADCQPMAAIEMLYPDRVKAD